MADKTILTKAQKVQIQKWLEEKWAAPGLCPVCQTKKFTISSHIVAPPIYSSGGTYIGGPSYPQVMTICNNCGHTLYFNVVRMDVLQPKEAKKEGQDDGE